MDVLFTAEYKWLWVIAMAAALFVPMRQLIWVISVRRYEKRFGPSDDDRKQSLKQRAGITSIMLALIFSFLYINQLFGSS